jgi:hypothetical protein
LVIGAFGRRLLRLAYFFNSFLGLLQYPPAVLNQAHPPFVLFEAVGQRDLTLLNLRDNACKLLDRLLKVQLFDITFLFLGGSSVQNQASCGPHLFGILLDPTSRSGYKHDFIMLLH